MSIKYSPFPVAREEYSESEENLFRRGVENSLILAYSEIISAVSGMSGEASPAAKKTSMLSEPASVKFTTGGHAPVVTLPDSDATPSVAGGNLFLTEGTTAITDFDGGVVGQTITVKAKTSITITDGGDLELAGDFAMTTGDTIMLTMLETGKWSEISRSNIA
jgi:hypothetical protein